MKKEKQGGGDWGEHTVRNKCLAMALNIGADLVVLKSSVILVVGMDEFSISHLSTVFPLSVVMASRSRVRVRAGAVTTSIAPFTVVHVAVHVRVFPAAMALTPRPVTCAQVT